MKYNFSFRIVQHRTVCTPWVVEGTTIPPRQPWWLSWFATEPKTDRYMSDSGIIWNRESDGYRAGLESMLERFVDAVLAREKFSKISNV